MILQSDRKFTKIATAGAVATMALAGSALGQSGDALIDKLVEKGILNVKEANQLRQESDKDFSQAYSVKSGMPEWVTSLKFNGDFRGRYEQNSAEDPEYHTRDRFRYRVRFGITATLVDDFEIGLRLASGNPQTNPGGTLVGGSPITANQDMNSLESRKFIWIDLAYAKWSPTINKYWSFSSTIGKMMNPFELSPMEFDPDINPEGAAIQGAYTFNPLSPLSHVLKFTGGMFVLDELNQSEAGYPLGGAPSHDPYFGGAQLVYEAKWTPKIETSLGAAFFSIGNRDALSAAAQPFYNSGNTRVTTPSGQLKYNYNPIIGTASATYKLDSFPGYEGVFPIKLAGEYMANPAAPANNVGYRAGVTIGKAGKKNTWEVNYRYQSLGADAWFDALVDDDNGAYYATGNSQLVGTGKANGWFGGTNVRGNLVQATYNLTDYLNLTFTCYLNELLIDTPGLSSKARHYMADIMWKF